MAEIQATVSRAEAMVAATSVETGRFRAVEKLIDGDDLLRLFDQLVDAGQGYLEVRSVEREFPLVTLGLRGGFAVIHCATAAERMGLLRGDGSVAPQEAIEVPIMDDLTTFTGDFVLTTAAARKALGDFVATGNPAGLGEWCDL